MAVQIRPVYTVAEFEDFLNQPENTDRIFELIDGEIIDVPSNPYVSQIAARILMYIGIYLLNNRIGHVTGADGGFLIEGQVLAPDVAYIAAARQPELPRRGFNPLPPDLAVEVISDAANSREQSVLRRTIVQYLAVGTVVWVVDPFVGEVEVYTSLTQTQVYGPGASLSGGEALPGFTLAVNDIFPQPAAAEGETE